jgi:hypothetical protein
MPKQFMKWITSTVSTLIDPAREDRVKTLAARISQGLKEQQKAFRIDRFKATHEFRAQELDDAINIVYRRLLERIWSDGELTEKENAQLLWVQECLGMPDALTMAMRIDCAEQQFGIALAQAMDDGCLSAEEEARLARIAKSVGKSTDAFSRRFFKNQGEAFLRGIFTASIEDGVLTPDEWQSLALTSAKLGIRTDELLQAVSRPAAEFVEHVLADAKADGRITEDKETNILWLLSTLKINPKFVNYARHELSVLRRLDEIAEGRLPSIAKPAGLEFRSGEIVHAVNNAKLLVFRLNAPHPQVHDGHLILMDGRMVFQSQTLAQSINYRKIVSHRGGADWIEFQVEQKPVWGIRFHSPDITIYAVLSKAIALSNQTAVRKIGDQSSRHIARDVRQRVWTRHGGRCADCNADDYLEFDHIIPVAKGGSNSDANVQLLCRRCNLKKSDHI